MERIICQCCGEALHKRGDLYVCGYCGATYRDDQAEGAADLLKGLLDDFKLEQLSNARRRLYETTHEKYPSSQAVTQAAGAVLSISPDDFMARIYLHSHDADPHELIGILSRGNVSEWEAKETVDWLVRSLDMRTLAAVKDFADRHLKGNQKTEALNRIEGEALKLDSGVYDLSLSRDVFLCYSTEDMPRVIEIMDMFEENALSCFAAFRNLRHGKGAQENYQEAIFRAMKNCRVFVFLSSNSSRDPHRKGVAEELAHLISDLKDKPRVEFLLEDYPERIPFLAKRRLEEAFPHLEHCRDAEDLLVRVSGLLDAEENAERDRARKIAEEASERAKKELQAEFEAREAARKEEQAKRQSELEERLAKEREEQVKRQRELEEERLRLEKEKLEIEKRRIEAQKGSSALPPVGGAMMERAEELKRKRAEEAADRKEAGAVFDVIRFIGTVEYSPKCKARIDVARKAYDALTIEQKAYVHNADVLFAAERKYDEAEAERKRQEEEAVEKKRAEAVAAIKAIGKVEPTPECRERIAAARAAYSRLSEGQRAHVHNADDLFTSEREYGEAEEKERERIKKEEDKTAKRIDAIFDMEILPDGNASVAKCRNKEITGTAIPELYRGKAVTSISKWAFSGCSSLKSITIPESVTSIGERAFSSCESLTSIAIPSSVTSIGDSAFFRCKSLTSIAIPSSVTSIGKNAFYDCSSLASITIPEGVTYIGNGPFAYCASLASIQVDPNNTKYDSRGGCNAIIETETNALLQGCVNTVIPKSVTTIGDSAFSGCSSLTSITIPESVTEIGKWAFSSCSSLKSITIPKSVTTIGECAFRDCSSLESIKVDPSNPKFDSRGGCNAIIETETNALLRGCVNTAIPSSVTSLGESAFSSCSSLTSITIPESVTSIGWRAFSGCSRLTSITIPSSVTSTGKNAFSDCKSLTSIVIPDGVECIADEAFYGCKSLTSITIPSSVTSIGLLAFSNCESLKSITIPSSVTTIGWQAFSGCSCETHFAHKKPLFGYPKGFSKECLKGFKGKAYWGGK